MERVYFGNKKARLPKRAKVSVCERAVEAVENENLFFGFFLDPALRARVLTGLDRIPVVAQLFLSGVEDLPVPPRTSAVGTLVEKTDYEGRQLPEQPLDRLLRYRKHDREYQSRKKCCSQNDLSPLTCRDESEDDHWASRVKGVFLSFTI